MYFIGKLHMHCIQQVLKPQSHPPSYYYGRRKCQFSFQLSGVVALVTNMGERSLIYVVVEFGHLVEIFRVLLLNLFMSLLSCSFLKVMSLNGYAMPWRLLELISLPAVLRSLPLKIKIIKDTQTRQAYMEFDLKEFYKKFNLQAMIRVQHKFCSPFICCVIRILEVLFVFMLFIYLFWVEIFMLIYLLFTLQDKYFILDVNLEASTVENLCSMMDSNILIVMLTSFLIEAIMVYMTNMSRQAQCQMLLLQCHMKIFENLVVFEK